MGVPVAAGCLGAMAMGESGGVGGVILATLWLAASESPPLGCQNCTGLLGHWVPVRPPSRPRRVTTRHPCPAGMNWIERAHQCCKQCPAGTFLSRPCSNHSNDSACTPCPPGTFRAQPNTFTECQACYECDRQGSGLEYVLLALTGPLFLGALVIYHKRKRLRQDAPAHSPLHTAQAATTTPRAGATSQCQEMERVTSTARCSPEHWALLQKQPSSTAWPGREAEPSAPPEPRSTLLQGSQLYTVIDAVPVRRWKEFMRVLELREAEIELVELEVAHIRDQQYEMLKRWCQQTSATLDRVFTALERMELAGCAEALRRSLLVGP
ncbi:PREDICTED: tumor necrosis factor receptor superfamily member 25 [Chaetura pelagica]|uniref:tumor necrosis factor receptor superfamily member 25 n=1 Tax=Chaetura pelagica TaxID=8897 RepID=UPI000523A188|nr:PREDICTED: tumor necrosis factor receptor superfamily member 25 [Chaetura pelagica]